MGFELFLVFLYFSLILAFQVIHLLLMLKLNRHSTVGMSAQPLLLCINLKHHLLHVLLQSQVLLLRLF